MAIWKVSVQGVVSRLSQQEAQKFMQEALARKEQGDFGYGMTGRLSDLMFFSHAHHSNAKKTYDDFVERYPVLDISLTEDNGISPQMQMGNRSMTDGYSTYCSHKGVAPLPNSWKISQATREHIS